jgi:AraC family transcriptional regulator of adaptative response/methylated-DNA-[protein]-cysteine methyltransferase
MTPMTMRGTTSPLPYATDEQRWSAVVHRDAAADGAFYYAVRTTGVYCRPTCPSRPARRENVSFHLTCAAAEQAGFRACRRCRPNEAGLAAQRAAMVEAACRQIENAEQPLSLDALAHAAGLSRFHFHRLFKTVTGVTPKQYADAHRAHRLRAALPEGGSVTQAIFDAGFNSSGRFYARSSQWLGMTPGRFRSGGDNERIRFAVEKCSLGLVLVAATDIGVCAILFGERREPLLEDLKRRFPKARLVPGEPDFEQSVAKVVSLVEAPRAGIDLPFDVRGTAFQQRVWQALRAIPPGATASYAEIARRIGTPRAVRAVAQACAANPVAVAIPCHRAVRNDGGLAGYRWGLERKQALLEREREE